MKAQELIHYPDYIKSGYWEERKRIYFATHPKACRVCGSPQVDLHHLHYGSYGREQDKHLAPLCRVHHEALHKWTGVRKNSYYQTVDFIESERIKFLKTDFTPVVKAPIRTSQFSFNKLIDDTAKPIWKILTLFGFGKKR